MRAKWVEDQKRIAEIKAELPTYAFCIICILLAIIGFITGGCACPEYSCVENEERIIDKLDLVRQEYTDNRAEMQEMRIEIAKLQRMVCDMQDRMNELKIDTIYYDTKPYVKKSIYDLIYGGDK